MPGTLLEKLESLFSKRFVVGSVPLLGFLLLHGVMAHYVSDGVRRWIGRYFALDNARLAVVSLAVLVVVVVLTYVSSALSVFLREVLEGRYLPRRVSNVLSQRYRDRLAAVEEEWGRARRHLRIIRTSADVWSGRMSDAYKAGVAAEPPVCNYRQPANLAALLDRRDGDQDITPQELQDAVDAMANQLRVNSAELAGNAASDELDNDHGALLHLIDYARDKWEAKVVDSLNAIQFDYAGKDVGPTRMGNIARVAPHYAASRYSMNLDIVWPRLQKVLQADANFSPVVQDAKMYVDFLIALVWLTASFTLFWVVSLPVLGTGPYLFVAIAVTGPIMTVVWYRIALQNYRALSELVRATIDLYRLDLLKALHLALPANAEHERTLWETLEQRLGYGDDVNIPFQHP